MSNSAPILIRGGTLVTSTDTCQADLLLVGPSIACHTPAGMEPPAGADVVDASGCLVFPGAVDAHTHLEMPLGDLTSADDWQSGTRAALLGGTTAIIDYAAPNPGETMKQAMTTWLQRAEGKTHADFALHMTVTRWEASTLGQMDQMLEAGISSFKVFTDYPGRFQLSDGAILRILRWAADRGALIQVHAINGSATEALIDAAVQSGDLSPATHGLCRPALLEGEATARVLTLAEIARAPVYLAHLSCLEALEALRAARRRGVRAYAETCPQYLYLSDEELARPEFVGARFVCNPPLRPKHHLEALWQGLAQGEIQAIATDHCPFTLRDRERGWNDFRLIPNGLPGIETRIPLLYQGVADGRIGLNRFVELVSTGPAKLLGLYPRKGSLAVGSDADVVIWDPRATTSLDHKALHMKVDYSIYEGRTTAGAIRQVYRRGKLVVEGGKLLSKAGSGRFMRRTDVLL